MARRNSRNLPRKGNDMAKMMKKMEKMESSKKDMGSDKMRMAAKKKMAMMAAKKKMASKGMK